jgi:hypothetical protein
MTKSGSGVNYLTVKLVPTSERYSADTELAFETLKSF